MDKAIKLALEQDLGKKGDITTNSLFKKNFQATAEIRVKDIGLKKKPGVLAGMAELRGLAGGFGVKIARARKDGSKIRFGDRVCILRGGIKELLKIERVALNLVCRMSGIATAVHRLSKRGVKIAATRKSPPGLMELDKKAVVIGGGLAHRRGLCGAILVKDNHLFALQKSEKLDKNGAIAEAIKRCRPRRVEIEVSNIGEAIAACRAGADIIMLDNFRPLTAKKTILALRRLNPKTRIELSGGINEKNLRQYSRAGADYISMGSITDSARVVDMNMKITEVKRF